MYEIVRLAAPWLTDKQVVDNVESNYFDLMLVTEVAESIIKYNLETILMFVDADISNWEFVIIDHTYFAIEVIHESQPNH